MEVKMNKEKCWMADAQAGQWMNNGTGLLMQNHPNWSMVQPNCPITPTPTSGATFTVDNIAPTLAEVTPVPTPDNDSTPDYTFSTDEAGTIAYPGTCSSATTSATPTNNTITLNSLADGSHSGCSLNVTDAAGNTSGFSNVISFVLDLTPPAVPIVLSPGVTEITNATPTFVGTAEPLSQVVLTVDQVTYRVQAGANGTWTIVVPSTDALSIGLHQISVRAIDQAGNASGTLHT